MSQCHWLLNSFSTCGVFLSSERSLATSSLKSWKVRSQPPLPHCQAHHKTTYLLKVRYKPKNMEMISNIHISESLEPCLMFFLFPLDASMFWLQTSSSEHFRSRPPSGTSLNQSEGSGWTQPRFRRCAASVCSTRRLCLRLRRYDSRY